MLTSQKGFSGYDYSGEHVSGEPIVLNIKTNKYGATLLHTPVKPGTVTLTSDEKIEAVVRDVPNADGVTGTFTDNGTGLGSGTINYATGEIVLDAEPKLKNVEVAFDYDQNSFDAPVDELDVRVVSEPVVARPRKLKSVYMFDVAYDKQKFSLAEN